MKKAAKRPQPAGSFALAPAERLWLPIISLAALLVRLPGMGESLWYDEIFYTSHTFRQPTMLDFLLWKDVHPPLYSIFLLIWTGLFGDGEATVRMPSLMAGLGSLFFFYLLVRRWFGPRPALLALALLALSPPHIWYSDENKVNMLLLFLCLAMVWFCVSALERRKPMDWVLATATLVLAILTHAYALTAGGIFFLWLFWRAREDRRLLAPIVRSAIVAGLVWVPLALSKLFQEEALGRGYLRPLDLGELYKLLLVWFPHGNTIRTVNPYDSFAQLMAQSPAYFLLDIFFAFLLARGLVRIWTIARGNGWTSASAPPSTWPARLILLWFVLPVAGTFAASLVVKEFYIERNLLIVLPWFILLLVIGAEGFAAKWARIGVPTLLVALSLFAVWNLEVLKADLWTVYKPNPDWISASRYFGGEMEERGALLVIATSPSNELPFYAKQIVLHKAPPGGAANISLLNFCSDPAQKIQQAFAERGWPSVYLIYNTTFKACFDDARNAFARQPRLKVVETRGFKGLVIYRYEVDRSP